MSTTTTIKAGDKVRATHRNGDVHTFTTGDVTEKGVWNDATGWFYGLHSWSFEVLERAKPPLPTTPGLYGMGRYQVFSALTTKGEWFVLDFTSSKLVREEEDAKALVSSWADRLTLVFDFAAYCGEVKA